jgi:hypothetical protein
MRCLSAVRSIGNTKGVCRSAYFQKGCRSAAAPQIRLYDIDGIAFDKQGEFSGTE